MENLTGELRRAPAPEAWANTETGSKRHRWFFFVVACLLFVVIAVAFAPTFYLRGLLRSHVIDAGLTPYIVLHGIVLTSCFVLLLAQTWTVATNHVQLHRRLGIVGIVLAVAILILSMMVVLRAPTRDAAMGATIGQIALGVVAGLRTLDALCGPCNDSDSQPPPRRCAQAADGARVRRPHRTRARAVAWSRSLHATLCHRSRVRALCRAHGL